MIRPRPGDFVYSASEVQVMARDIELFGPHAPAGFVFGVLDAEGHVASGSCWQLQHRAGVRPCAFHRAFDKTPDVKIPKEKAGAKPAITTPIKGSGQVLASGDDVLANVAIYVWSGKTSRLLESTFTAIPQVLPSNIGLSDAKIDRKRINGMVTVQFAPSENTTTAGSPFGASIVAPRARRKAW